MSVSVYPSGSDGGSSVTVVDYVEEWPGFQVQGGMSASFDMSVVTPAVAGTAGSVALEIDTPAGIFVFAEGTAPGVVRVNVHNTGTDDFPNVPTDVNVHFKVTT